MKVKSTLCRKKKIFINLLNILNILFAFTLIKESQAESEYCKIKCPDEPTAKHTMCLYDSPKLGPACSKYGTVSKSGITPEDQQKILDKHNELRKKVADGNVKGQPAATNLYPLKWNVEAATIAQRWANQCIVDHDKCIDLLDGTAVGQNLGFSSKGDITTSIQDWFDEVKDVDSSLIENFQDTGDNPLTGHYTQLVWADTTAVGCGYIRYAKSKTITGNLLICNYVPSGNYEDEPVYDIKNKH